MKKAVISNRIYLNECPKGSSLEKKLVANLYFEINRMPQSPYPLIINNVQRVTDTVVTIPSGCTHLIPDDYVIVDKRTFPSAEIPALKGELREDQNKAVHAFPGNGRVDAKPGYGKTWVGLGLAHRHQTRTLIITTTTVIRDMWVKEIQKNMGFKPGVVGGGKFNIEPPIVVGNIQTVRNRLPELSKEFGLIIVDEVHRAPAATFTNVLNSLHAKIKVGLSGTMIRKDGLHVVLPGYFGNDMFIGKDENTMDPVVHIYKTDIELSANEYIPWSIKINQLMANQKYIKLIEDLANVYMDAGHKVLIVADRTEFLETLHLRMPDRSLIVTGKIKGEEVRSQIFDAIIEYDGGISLCGTQSIFAEGVSINPLSCLIMATPINNEPLLAQIIARIQRLHTGKPTPIVVDINFIGNTGINHANNRKKYYIEKGWSIQFP